MHQGLQGAPVSTQVPPAAGHTVKPTTAGMSKHQSTAGQWTQQIKQGVSTLAGVSP